jgi:glutamate:GABA antiporter
MQTAARQRPAAVAEPHPPALKQALRFRDLTLFYVATTLSIRWVATAAAAGPGSLVIWIFGFAGFFLPLAYSVLVLARRFPQEGGLYVWTREAFGDGAGFLAAWTYWMSNQPYFASILYFGAGSALFAAGPRGAALAANPAWFMGFAVVWLAIITAVNIRGMHQGKWLNNLCSAGTWLPIAVLVLLAMLAALHPGSAHPASATRLTAQAMAPHLSLRNAIFWSTIFFAFAGVEAGSAMGAEIANPRRTVPRALVAAGLIIVVAYIAGTAALLLALPAGSVSGVDSFMLGAQQLCHRLGLPWLVPLLAVLVALGAVGGAAAYLSSTSRLPFVAGIDRYLPAAFGRIHPRFHTPWIALVSYGLAGIAVAILGQAGATVHGAYDVMVSMSVITTLLPFLGIFAAVLRFSMRRNGPLLLPGGRGLALTLAAIGFLTTALTIVLSTIPAPEETNKPLALAKVLISSAVVVLAGIAVFALGRRKKQHALVPPASV